MSKCFVCDQMFEYGNRPGVYRGRVVQGWGKEMICRRCEDSNWDGIVPRPELVKKFADKGIQPNYNKNDWIVIPA